MKPALSSKVNSMRPSIALLLFLLSIDVLGQTEPVEVNERNALAQPLLIVPPAYPKGIPADNPSARIRMKGMINTRGQLVAPEFDNIEGEAGFVDAIREVVEFWRFRPAIEMVSCKTKDSEGVLFVWFEMKDGKPSVSVSMPVRQEIESALKALSAKPRVYVRRPKMEFPTSARRNRVEGAAEVLLAVNGQGDIVDSTVVYSVPGIEFGDSLLRGIRSVKFSADESTENPGKTTCISQTATFCLGNAKYSHPICK
jgi:TonB family protein